MPKINQSSVQVLTTELTKGGITLPKTITDELARLEVLHRHPGPERVDTELVEAVATAYADGREPTTDDKVMALVKRQSLAAAAPNWPYVLGAWAEDRIGDLFTEHLDSLMQTCADAVTKAGNALADALPHLDGKTPLRQQAETSLRGGAKTAEAWRVATESVARIDALVNAQQQLIHVVSGRTYHPALLVLLLRCHTAPLDVRDASIAGGYTADTWRLAGEHRLPIIGASLDDIEEALARLAGERDAVNAALANAERARGARAYRVG